MKSERSDEWTAALAHRKRALAPGTAEEVAEHTDQVRADKLHARRRFFPVRATTWKKHRNTVMPPDLDEGKIPIEAVLPPIDDEQCDETGLPEWPNMDEDAKKYQDWLRYGSWGMCKVCHRLLTRPLKPIDMRNGRPAECAKCSNCTKPGSGYPVSQPSDQPAALQNLTPDIVAALRPLAADPGPCERANQGYRVHTSMTRIRWEAQSVKEKIAALPTHRERKQARRAWKYLMTAEASSYKLFYKKHKAFLAKTKDDGESQSSSDEPSEATAKQKQRQRQLPLNYIETIGLECAIWPHLYWATDMCETAIRARNRLGKDSGSESSSEEDDESDGKEEGAKQRHS